MNSDIAPPADAIAAVTHPHPYPWYAVLRKGPALVRDESLGLWIASRADVVRELLDCHALRVRPPGEPVPAAIAGTPAGQLFGRLVRMNDGATHRAHRPALHRGLAALDPVAARAAVLRVAMRMPEATLFDTCMALPVWGVAHLLGFADDALPPVCDGVRDFVACLSPLAGGPELQAASVAASALMATFEQLVAAPAARSGSLLRAVQAEAPADRSNARLANLVGLLSQTCEATAGLLGNCLLALAREPGLRRTIDARPERIDAMVREVARHDPSVQNTRRFVAEPAVVAGVPLAPGDTVLIVLAAANRDPALNPAPATFEWQRADRRMLGFGHGVHACPGHMLACTVAAAGVEALLARGVDTSRLVGRGWHYRPSTNTRIPVFH